MANPVSPPQSCSNPRFSSRHEHRPRGDRGAPLRHALLRPVPHLQPVGHGLHQQREGQPRRGAGDGQREGGPDGAAGVHHRISHGVARGHVRPAPRVPGQHSYSHTNSQRLIFPSLGRSWPAQSLILLRLVFGKPENATEEFCCVGNVVSCVECSV